jgi:hypothetical protein
MNTNDVKKLIEESALEPHEKLAWTARVESEGLTSGVLAGLKSALQRHINDKFAELGVDVSKSPEYKKEEKKMMEGMEKATKELQTELADVEKQIDKVKTDAAKQIDKAQAAAIKSAM